MNKSILSGRLTKDPELKHTNSDKSVCQFTLAVNKPYGDKQADFINCVAWNKTAENLCKYQQKGSRILVEGSIQTRSYDDSNGTKRFITEVVVNTTEFLDKKSESTSNNTNDYQAPKNDVKPKSGVKTEKSAMNDMFSASDDFAVSNDDLPF